MRYKKVLIRTLSILIVIVLAVETIWDFSSQVQRALTRETYRTLSEVSHDYNKAFVDHISYNGKTMNVLANALQEMRGQSKQDVIRMLKNAMSDGGFTQMLACDTKGLSCSSDGIVEDLSQRDYFQKAMYGLAVGSSPPISVVATEESILLAVPISHEGETVGILFGRYPLAVVGSELLNFNYYRDGYGFVVSPDGTILFSSEHTDKLANEKNLFSFFEKTSLIHFSMEELKTAIANGKSKSFAFTYNGERRFVSFMPSTINDWVTFSISSDALMLQQEKVTNQIVLRLITRLAVAGVLLFAWIVWRNRRHNKEILAANQQYQSLLSHINGGMIVAVHAQTAQETIATYVSPGFTDMTGYTLEDLQNLYHGRYLDVILAEEREAVFKKYLEQLAVGNTYWMPYRIRKKDGSFLWVMDNGYLVRGADGLHNHSIITDITAVKAQEEELRMSESRFSVAINASSGTLLEVDLKQKVFTHFENSKRIFAVSAQRLLDDTRAFSLLPYDEFMDAVI
ncbi:MAG: cache domain-containing protein, partial [Clostridia bacterium]